MKLTPTLKQSLDILKKNKILYKKEDLGLPYNYVPKKYKDMEFKDNYNSRYFSDGIWAYSITVNSQSIGKLILMGYAEWGKNKETVIYVDRTEWAIQFLEAQGYKVIKN